MNRNTAKSPFAEALTKLLDNTGLYTRREWAKLLGIKEASISQWLSEETIPRASNLNMIYITVENASDAEKGPLKAFRLIAELPALTASPKNGKRMLPRVWEYMKRPVFDELSSKLAKLSPDDQEKLLETYFPTKPVGSTVEELGELLAESSADRVGPTSPTPIKPEWPIGSGVVAALAAAGVPGKPSHPARLVKVLDLFLDRMRKNTIKDVYAQLKTVTCRFAQRNQAAVAWLSRSRSTDWLEAIVVQESAQRQGHEFRLDDPGIVPRVGRTGVPYASGDVRDDPYYATVYDGVASEQAVSVVVQGADPGVHSRCVVNQESKEFAQYNAASAELLREDVEVELTPLLRELEALQAAEPFVCCWNPRRYGWGLREYLATLLQQVKEDLEEAPGEPQRRGLNNLHMAVWYVDQEDRVLSPVADTGFTDGVQFRQVLTFADDAVLGQLATAEDWETATWQPNADTANRMHPSVRDVMGARGSRLAVTPELSGPKGAARFRIIVQVTAFAAEAEQQLPDGDELGRFAQLLFEQVRGYLSLYPRLAADEIRRALHACRTFPEQWQAAARTIETVLRAGAVTLYARPWQDEGNLHMIAATTPLKRSDGTSMAPDPEPRPVLSLLPSVHRARDRGSYTGTLAGRPGAILRRNSYRQSGERMLLERFPLWPSSDYSESLARTESADPRFLGYALPNQKEGRSSTAVALAVRPVDRAPFKAWDVAALVHMLDAAAPMVQSWRDWAAVRLDKAQQVIEETRDAVSAILGTYALSIDRSDPSRRRGDRFRHLHHVVRTAEQSIFQAVLADSLARGDTMPHRLQDPIPRIGSLAALSREVAADAYERAWRAILHERTRSESGDYWSARAQATVLMEARGNGGSVMHPVAYFHEHVNVVPRAGTENDPRRLRLPDLGDDWRGLLDDGRPREYRNSSAIAVRIPFLAWIGQHAARGALTLDLPPEEIPADAIDFRKDLMLLARRLAAAWTAAGSLLPRGQFVSRTSRGNFEENLRLHIGAAELHLHLADPSRPSEIGDDLWDTPTITFERPDRQGVTQPDPDAQLWGIQEANDGRSIALQVPLVFGTLRVGLVVARWCDADFDSYHKDPRTVRSLWVRDILAAWSLWSWSWTTMGHSNHDDALVFVDVREQKGIWEVEPHWVAAPRPSPQLSRRRNGPERAFELMHPRT